MADRPWRAALSRLSRPDWLSRAGWLSFTGWLSRATRLARRHWIFTVLLGLGLGLRVIVMIAYQPAIFYVDSVASYLLPMQQHLDPTGEDPIGYVLYLLAPVLWAGGNLATVVAVQHLFGLGMAVAGYALLIRQGAWRALAALATVPVLLDGYQLQIEQNIMSEPLFEAMLVTALVVLTWRPRPGPRAVIVAGVLLGLAATVRQAGELAALPLVAYPLMAGGWRPRRAQRGGSRSRRGQRGGGWRYRLGLGATAAAAFGVPVALYAAYFFIFSGHLGISHVGGNALYGRTATVADCATLRLPADEQVLCPRIPRDQRAGPDYWAHDPASPYFVLQGRDSDRVDQLSKDFGLRVIRHQPLDFAAAVARDAVKALAWSRGNHPTDPPVERWQFQQGIPLFPPVVDLNTVTALSHQYGDVDPVAVAPLTSFLRGYQLHGGYTPGPVLALSLLLALAPLARWRRAGPARLPALLFLAVGVLVVLSGDLMIFSWRYQLPAYVLLPVAGALGLTAVLGRGRPTVPASAASPGSWSPPGSSSSCPPGTASGTPPGRAR